MSTTNGSPAAVAGDRITGLCAGHMIPSPTGTAPAPPLPFSAPLTTGLATKVLIGGKPAAVVGSGGISTPPHTGLADAFAAPPTQRGVVVSGQPSVLVEGKPIATLKSRCSMCLGPATTLVATAATVLVG